MAVLSFDTEPRILYPSAIKSCLVCGIFADCIRGAFAGDAVWTVYAATAFFVAAGFLGVVFHFSQLNIPLAFSSCGFFL